MEVHRFEFNNKHELELIVPDELRTLGYRYDLLLNCGNSPFGIIKYFDELDERKSRGEIDDWVTLLVNHGGREPLYDVFVKEKWINS